MFHSVDFVLPDFQKGSLVVFFLKGEAAEEKDICFEILREMTGGRAVYPSEKKAGMEIHVCKATAGRARAFFFVDSEQTSCSTRGVFEEGRFFFSRQNNELCSRMEQAAHPLCFSGPYTCSRKD